MKDKIIISIFLAAVVYSLYKLFLYPRLVIQKANRKLRKMNEHRIDRISNSDFDIYLKGTLKNVKWSEVNSIEFTSKDSLTVLLNDNTQINILSNYLGRLEFIRKVPKGIHKFDYEYVESYFRSLKSCKICGLFSIENGSCLNCDYSDEFLKAHQGDISLDSFYKEEQLDYFTVYFDKDESVEKTLIRAKQSNIFEVDINWKIYPTRDEILKAKNEMK